MKKLLILLLSLLMILSFVGCNNKNNTHTHLYEVNEYGVWVCKEDKDILSNTDKPYVALLENNEPKDIISLDKITSSKTNLGNGVIYREDNTIFYNGNNAQNIIIKTEKDNKTKKDILVINAPNDTVYHYGSSSIICLDAVDTNSFHEYGKVDLITLTKARIVLEDKSEVKEIYLDINNSNYNYETSIIALKDKVELPNLSRGSVNLKENEVKILAVIQQLKEETKEDNTIEIKTEEENFVKIENVAKSDKDLIIQAFLSPNSDTKDNTKVEKTQTSTDTLEEARVGSNHPASKNTFVSKDEKVKGTVIPKEEKKQEPEVTPASAKKESKKEDPTPTPTVTKYTVTFDMGGHGTEIPSQTIESGSKVTKPENPTATGYTFDGWYKETSYENEWRFDTDTVTKDTTIYAKWGKAKTVKDVLALNSSFPSTEEKGWKNDNYENYKIFYADGVLSVSVGETTRSIVGGYEYVTEVSGGYNYQIDSRLLSFCVIEGKLQSIIVYGFNEQYMAPYTDGTYSAPYTVSFDMQGHGTEVPSQTINYNGKATKPTDPTVEGWNFKGWYKEKECINEWKFDTDTVTINTILYAKWAETKTIEQILPKDFPITFDKGWATSDGQKCYVNDGKIYFKQTSPSRTSYDSLSEIIEKTDNGYILNYSETQYLLFSIENDVLVSITLHFDDGDYNDALNGTYSSPKTFKAVYDKKDNANTLTFYYDNKTYSGDNITVYDNLPTAAENPTAWGYNSNRSSVKKVEIDSSVANYKGLTSTAYMFQGMNNAGDITGAEHLDVSNVTNMCMMFYKYGSQSTALSVVPNVSDWNTGKVTNMSSMFREYGSKSETFAVVPNVRKWNTGSVTDMSYMFQSYGSASKVLEVVPTFNENNWNTANVENMSNMFNSYGKSSEKLNAAPDMSKWNTSSLKNISSMFKDYGFASTVLNAVPTVSGSKWNTGNVTDMSYMFASYGNNSLVLDKVPDVSNWNTKKVTNIAEMFFRYGYSSTALTKVPDVSNWNTSSVTDVNCMFQYYGYSSESLNFKLDLSEWSVVSMTDGNNMFDAAGAAIPIDSDKWNVIIPAKTGEWANDTTHWYVWYVSDGSPENKYIEPAKITSTTYRSFTVYVPT